MDPLDQYPAMMTPHEVAAHLGVSPFTLRGWRRSGRGPVYIRLSNGPNATIRYPREELRAYLAGGRVMPAVEATS